VDKGLEAIQEVKIPSEPSNPSVEVVPVPDHAPDFVKTITAKMMKQEGDTVKVSEMPADGVWMTGTTQYEKRNIALHIPVWGPDACIQCGRCSLVCPHAAIRPKAYDPKYLEGAPEAFKSADAKGKDLTDLKYTLQVAPEDCTGCGTCAEQCPAKAKGALQMADQEPLRDQEAANYGYFLNKIPNTDPAKYNLASVKGSQFVQPLFEYSGACAGCGETAYVKLVSQLFGDRALIANATGCSSIYGGNLPTTPYRQREDGRGPTWNNSLFEDCAELSFGMRLSVDQFSERARALTRKVLENGGADAETKKLLGEILQADQSSQAAIDDVRVKIDKAREGLAKADDTDCKELTTLVDYLAKKSVWAFGGDGWAYDIGYGGVDHVLASGKDINVLVLDTEVYSNTGGQASKATPMGAVARFAASGKPVLKKDLGMMAMSYGYIYVAKVALGANPNQVVKAIAEAEAYKGPSLIICYAHCINHGINMTKGLEQQKLAVESGHWPLYRYNPALTEQGKNPLQLDSKEPSIPLADYVFSENRYKILQRSKPELSEQYIAQAQVSVKARYQMLKDMAAMSVA
ncbi:MAG: 4Fe-4S dicluster domain-containing protein, partial [Chitinivibrionales bacterium]|nr:4Fe-4S dicluster domain-containing protein [Chitinivibrionales bacterium]MBD3356821.1 4Fe-4S dicluster domain-containing protein [Chitinivibrionales bacterium]